MNGMRFDYTHGGQRTIEVVSDKFAWNEDTPGGKATPMPAALQERQVQLVLTPIGMAKAAKAAGDAAKVSTTAGVTTLTFPANGATITATLEQVHGAGQGRSALRNDRSERSRMINTATGTTTRRPTFICQSTSSRPRTA